jgi:hypothetical protein
LGLLAVHQEAYEIAGERFIKCLLMFAGCDAPHEMNLATNNFLRLYGEANTEVQKKLKELWGNAGLPELPER